MGRGAHQLPLLQQL